MKKKTLSLIMLFILLILFNCKSEPVMKILGEDSSNLRALEHYKKEFEDKENVKLEFIGNEFEVAYQKANQDFANKTGIYDIVLQYNFSLSNFVRNDFVFKIEDIKKVIKNPSSFSFEKYLFKNAWEEVGYYFKNLKDPYAGDTPIGYPFASNTMILVYNKELFENAIHQKAYKEKNDHELKVPKTWEELIKIAEYFTQKDKSLFGICLQGGDQGWIYYEWCNFLYSLGGSVMDKNRGWKGDENTKILINSREAKKAIENYKKLKDYNIGDFFSTGAIEQVERMKSGTVAMCIMWSDYLYGLIFNNGNDKPDKRFGFAQIPGDRSMLAGGIFYINKKSKKKEIAMKYVTHVMQKDMQIKLMKKGLCSAHRMAYEDVEVKKLIPYCDALKRSLERGVYMAEAGSDADAISEIITDILQKIWLDKLDIKEGLEIAERNIQVKRRDIFLNLKK